MFQGVAADGAKEALYELVKAGFRVVNFIHDEYLIEIPAESDLVGQEAKVKEIMIGAMQKHLPDVPVEVDVAWGERWLKSGTHQLDSNGKLVPLNNAQ